MTPDIKYFWRIDSATEGVGTYPQVEGMRADYDFDSPSSIRTLSDYRLGRSTVDVGELQVARSCHLTDWLSCVPFPSSLALVSDRLRGLLMDARLPPHAFYRAEISRSRQEPVPYWAFHLPQTIEIPENLPPRDVSDLIASEPRLGQVDLLRIILPLRYSAWFITGRLREKFLAEGVTGIRYGRGKLREPQS